MSKYGKRPRMTCPGCGKDVAKNVFFNEPRYHKCPHGADCTGNTSGSRPCKTCIAEIGCDSPAPKRLSVRPVKARDSATKAGQRESNATTAPRATVLHEPAPPSPTLRAQLRAAILADPRSEAQIARVAGMEPAALSRLLREDKPRDGALSTWERVAAALGLRVALVKDGHGAP